jgi:hypothetical protein
MLQMKNIDRRELSLISAIEGDLAAARHASRFEDVLNCLDEILVHHKFTESNRVKLRCASLLRAA